MFHAKCEELESGGCFRWEFVDGKAWIYELPLDPHEGAAAEVIRRLEHAMGPRFDDFRSSTAPRCRKTANQSFEPDGSLKVRGFKPGQGHPDAADALGNRYPNLVVEVALEESEPHVKSKALQWLDTATDADNGVQQVIAIKIGEKLRVSGHRTMKAWRYERGAADNPVQWITFGNDDGPGNGAATPGRPGMRLHIPVASLYLPLAPPDDFADSLVLDLYYIRRTIEEAFE